MLYKYRRTFTSIEIFIFAYLKICLRVMYDENWFRKERDNLSKKYPTLPPIESGKVVTQTGTAFIL